MRRTRYLWVAVLVLSAAVIAGAEIWERTAHRSVAEVAVGVSWMALDPLPDLPSAGFWAVDQPDGLKAEAFGRLPPEHPIYLTSPQVQRYRLETKLPRAPRRVAVFLVGRYPDADESRFTELVQGRDGWTVYPKISIVQFEGDQAPPGASGGPVTSGEMAIERARRFLAPFLLPDSAEATAAAVAEGWRVDFQQRVEGVPIYGDKPMHARIGTDGHLLFAQGRRRPILYRSEYPLRSARDAWADLASGKGLGFTLISGAPVPEATVEFVVTAVELCYLVPHVFADLEVMHPYWAFRDATGAALFVPAVADPFVTWPRLP